MAVSQSNIVQTDGEKKLLSLCNKGNIYNLFTNKYSYFVLTDNTGDVVEQLKETLKEPGVRVDATDEVRIVFSHSNFCLFYSLIGWDDIFNACCLWR